MAEKKLNNLQFESQFENEHLQEFFLEFSAQLNRHLGGKNKEVERFDEMMGINEYILLRDISSLLFEIQDLDQIITNLNTKSSKEQNYDKVEKMAFVLYQ